MYRRPSELFLLVPSAAPVGSHLCTGIDDNDVSDDVSDGTTNSVTYHLLPLRTSRPLIKRLIGTDSGGS